jgi:hypothetical protein
VQLVSESGYPRAVTLRAAEAFKCAQCTALLPIDDSSRVVVCPYCGTHNRISEEDGKSRGAAPPAAPARPSIPTPASSASISPVGVVLMLTVVAALGLVTYFGVRSKPKTTSAPAIGATTTPTPQDPRTASGAWFGWGAICLEDTNGDGTRDVIGLTSGAQVNAVAVDGAKGAFLWVTPMADADAVYCAGGSGPIVGRAKFQISRLDVHTGKQAWEKMLHDDVSSFSGGADCMRIALRDESTVILSSQSGEPVEKCDPTTTMDTETSLRKAQELGIAIGPSLLRVTTKGGSPRIEVIGSTGANTWTKLLEVTAVGTPLVAPTVDGLVVLGGVPGDANTIVWTFLRALDGEVGYRVQETFASSADVRTATVDGDRVFFTGMGRLHAIDRTTGKKLWWVGHD